MSNHARKHDARPHRVKEEEEEEEEEKEKRVSFQVTILVSVVLA